MKASLTVVLFLLGFMAISQALSRDIDTDDERDLNFEARLKTFADMRAHPEAEGEGWSKEELSKALKKLLPENPDLREPALAELFMDLMDVMEEEGHPKGQGHMYDERQGRRGGPESFARFHDRKFPGPR